MPWSIWMPTETVDRHAVPGDELVAEGWLLPGRVDAGPIPTPRPGGARWTTSYCAPTCSNTYGPVSRCCRRPISDRPATSGCSSRPGKPPSRADGRGRGGAPRWPPVGVPRGCPWLHPACCRVVRAKSNEPVRGQRRLRGMRLDRYDAYRALFEAEHPQLVCWLTAATGDRQLAQDLGAEAFIRLLVRGPGVREPRAYLYVVAGRLVIDESRRRARRARTQRDLDARARTATSSTADVELRDLVERLPERYRLVMLLHYYADLPVADVATVLRKPVGTVKRLLHEAREQLAEILEERHA